MEFTTFHSNSERSEFNLMNAANAYLYSLFDCPCHYALLQINFIRICFAVPERERLFVLPQYSNRAIKIVHVKIQEKSVIPRTVSIVIRTKWKMEKNNESKWMKRRFLSIIKTRSEPSLCVDEKHILHKWNR